MCAQIPPTVDTGLRQQLEDMGFSANKYAIWMQEGHIAVIIREILSSASLLLVFSALLKCEVQCQDLRWSVHMIF